MSNMYKNVTRLLSLLISFSPWFFIPVEPSRLVLNILDQDGQHYL
jgi:hypothetical protein